MNHKPKITMDEWMQALADHRSIQYPSPPKNAKTFLELCKIWKMGESGTRDLIQGMLREGTLVRHVLNQPSPSGRGHVMIHYYTLARKTKTKCRTTPTSR